MSEAEGTSVKSLFSTLQASIPCEHVVIEDVSGCGCGQKFNLFASSKSFEGVGILQRHRMVQEALKEGVCGLLLLWICLSFQVALVPSHRLYSSSTLFTHSCFVYVSINCLLTPTH